MLGSFDDIEAVGHRIVQGADFFSGSTLVNDDVLKKIEICCDFAPLHNPAHLLGIHAISHVLPDVPQVVTFDTAFHQTMQPQAYMYALPYEYYTKYRVRRYGAHGTSHQYVSRRGAALAGLDLGNSKIITCHLGNGSSITAVQDGKSIDTSMGFTPLEGMIMGTRCGNIDANIVPFIMKKENLTPDQMTEVLNNKSGFIGLSGKSSDMRDLTQLASDLLRKICGSLTYLGIRLDDHAQANAAGEIMISAPDSAVKVAMIPTNEELVIARDTMHIVSEL